MLEIMSITVLMFVTNELLKAKHREKKYKKLLGREGLVYLPSSEELFEVYHERRNALSLLPIFTKLLIKEIAILAEKHRDTIIKESENQIIEKTYKQRRGAA